MRKYLSTILLVLTLPIGELHTYWAKDTRVQNWIVVVDRPMLMSWNIKFLMMEVTPVFYFLAWVLWQPNRANKTTVRAFLFLAVFDLVLYVYNFKTSNFGLIYFWFVGFWLLSYVWQIKLSERK